MLYVFGVMGYFMKKFDMPPAPVVLSVVLGPMMERALRQSLTMSLGSYDIFFTRPISAACCFWLSGRALARDRHGAAAIPGANGRGMIPLSVRKANPTGSVRQGSCCGVSESARD